MSTRVAGTQPERGRAIGLRRIRFTLRWRVALTFAVASMVLASLLSIITLRLATEYMLDQRQQSANLQASVNHRLVESTIQTGSEGLPELLSGLVGDPGLTVLVRSGVGWLTSGRAVDPESLPADLIQQASEGSRAGGRRPSRACPCCWSPCPVTPTAACSFN